MWGGNTSWTGLYRVGVGCILIVSFCHFIHSPFFLGGDSVFACYVKSFVVLGMQFTHYVMHVVPSYMYNINMDIR